MLLLEKVHQVISTPHVKVVYGYFSTIVEKIDRVRYKGRLMNLKAT